MSNSLIGKAERPSRYNALRLLGLAGVFVCVIGVVYVWSTLWRIDRARAQALVRVNTILDGLDNKLLRLEQLAAESKVTLEDCQQRLADWTKEAVGDRLASRLEIDASMERVTARLKQGEVLLQSCGEAVQHVAQILELAADLGLSVDANVVDPLSQRVASLTDKLHEAVVVTESLEQRFDKESVDESEENWGRQLANAAAKLLTTLGAFDGPLTAARERLVESKETVDSLNARARTKMFTITVCATVFIVWMAIGQVCLSRSGRVATESLSQ